MSSCAPTGNVVSFRFAILIRIYTRLYFCPLPWLTSVFFDDGREDLVDALQRLTTNNVSSQERSSYLHSIIARAQNYFFFVSMLMPSSDPGTNFNHGTETRSHPGRLSGALPRQV